MIDIRTEKEKERDARNDHIRVEYENMRQKMPDVPEIRIFKILAKKYRVVWNTIRYIVKG